MSEVTFRPDIEGLRAVAVLIVIAFHYNPEWLPGGFIGVDVFLVISGFLITSILLKKKAQKDNSLISIFAYFYLSRFKRILPAYFCMLTVVSFVAALLFVPQDFATFEDGLKEAVLFNSNNFFAEFGSYFAPAAHEQPLLHTWSLAVEIQFYLLAPMLVLLLPRRTLKWLLLISLISFSLLAEYRLSVVGIEQATYYSLYARLPAFFAGGLVALFVEPAVLGKGHKYRAAVGAVLILSSAIFQPSFGHFPGISALLPVLGAALLLLNPSDGIIGRALTNKTLVWLGGLSYSLYLWHWPILALLRYSTGADVLNLEASILFVLMTFALSILSSLTIERFFQKKEYQVKQRVVSVGFVIALLGVPQGIASTNLVFTPKPKPIEYSRYADLTTICHGEVVGECLVGDLTSSNRVLVLGDSHAAMLNLFFDYLGEELDFKAKIITASNCVTIPGFDYHRIPEWGRASCQNQIEIAERLIKNASIIFLAGAWNYQTKSEEFRAAIKRFLDDNADKEVVILSQIPRFKQNIQRVQRFSSLGLPATVERDPSYEAANDLLKEMTEQHTSTRFFELDSLPVFDEAPFYAGKLTYKDAHHVNEIGAKAYALAAEHRFSEYLRWSGAEP